MSYYANRFERSINGLGAGCGCKGVGDTAPSVATAPTPTPTTNSLVIALFFGIGAMGIAYFGLQKEQRR